MTRPKWTLCLAGAVLTLATGCATTEPQSDTTAHDQPAVNRGTGSPSRPLAKLSDADITEAVESVLFSDGTLHDGDVTVNTTDGVVELVGTTDNLISKQRAEQLAATIKGVRAISNRIRIEADHRPDADLSHDIRHALKLDSATEAYDVDVEVHDQVATLTGKVESQQERQLAERTAKSVRGVRRVNDQIEVAYADQRPDAEIRRDVMTRLHWDALVGSQSLEARVRNGIVSLSGDVGSLTEKVRARNDAWVAGVKDVNDDRVDIRWWAARDDVRSNLPSFEPDDEIENALGDAILIDPRVSAFDVDVSSDAGIVTLTGTVSSAKAKRAAEQLARDTIGVNGVKNEIVVSLPRPLSDVEIEGRARAALLFDAIIPAPKNLSVSVKHGVVTLSGSVGTKIARMEAADAVSAITGVTEVKNELKVGAS